MENQLKIYGILHKLNLATWEELRNIANNALNKEIYSLSLVDAALDADENIHDIGLAFEKALAELNIIIPQSINKCRWLSLKHYINQIANEKVVIYKGLINIMKVYNGCNLHKKSRYYAGDSHDIHYFVGYYWAYNDIQQDFSLTLEDKKEITINCDRKVIEIANSWLQRRNCSITAGDDRG
ncbi:hypothetical protein H1P_1360020 [Hyella patelloides LEGE 07179]|uniref:Uncharacterized protein n=1 Tax=Hyella patelloides LEGE 07179 TaxID=945734 RepID=A0A563VL22_9CYAN|nr:hypothetical protein [Hyella patelloides]VEP12150.1 hypothetical protein H1P_1360020 [Hyella patelloides LEGE 07179]